MSVPHVINTDLVDKLVEVPLIRAEAGQVLAYYLPLVDAMSPEGAWKNHFLVARLHLGALVGRALDRHTFVSAVELGSEVYARRTGAVRDVSYSLWTEDQLFEDMSADINELLGGAL